MEGHAKKCVERYCELANKTTQQLYKVATPCVDDHQLKEENESVGDLSTVCSQIVLKCLYLARIGRLGFLWSVNKLTRAVTKWTKSCDKRLARLISYIFIILVNSSNIVMWETQHTNADLDWKIISLDAGLRMDGIPALTLWDLVIEALHSVPNRTEGPKRELRGNPSAIAKSNMHNPIPIKHTNFIPTNIDHIPSNTTNSGSSAMLYVFEDNEAVINLIVKGRSPTLRHVSRTHRVALDWLFDRISMDPKKIQIRYFDTKHQLADMLTKGNFTRDEWNNLLHLLNISHFSATCCTNNFSLISCSTMARRIQNQNALGSCDILTVRHVCSVAPYGRGDATGAVLATAIHHFGNCVLETPFRTLAAWASGCTSWRPAHEFTSASELATSAPRRTLGRQPTAELLHPEHRPH